jgi:hypothetical protein
MFTSAEQQQALVLRITERLHAASIGDVVSYAQLSTAAGVDILAENRRWMIERAREMLIKDHGVAFATVRGEGYRRLGAAPGVDYVSLKGVTRVRRVARLFTRRVQRLVHHANDLSPAEQRTANQRLCALGLIEHISRAQTVSTLPEVPQPKPDGLDGLRQALGMK